jgi:hypothetical protein
VTRHDVFNGDADGLCAVQQWRLAHPAADAIAVTGAKRDIALLQRVDAAAGDEVTVFDVSLHVNRDALGRALAAGARVRWFDHHYAGEPPVHPALDACIDTRADTCTSLIVDARLGHRFATWAAVGAFGDNLHAPARALCEAAGLDRASADRLAELGEALNYNAYGDDVAELPVHPAELRRAMTPHADPLAFAAQAPVCTRLLATCREDLERACAVPAWVDAPGAAVWRLPDAPWARRVRGAFGNLLAVREPRRAHAIVVPRADGAYTVSLRVPAGARTSADAFCRAYPRGGGRAIAAGIDAVAPDALDGVVRAFVAAYPGDAPTGRSGGA